MRMLLSIISIVLLCLFFIALPTWVHANQVYVCTDDKGTSSLQDFPCAAGNREAHRYYIRDLTQRSRGWDNQYSRGHGRRPQQHVIVQDEIVIRTNPSTRPRHERGTLSYAQRNRVRQLEINKDRALDRGGWAGRQEARDINREIRQIYRTAED